MDLKKDYYDILAVSKTASVEIIKKKYRELAKVYHPDQNSDMDDETRKENEKKFRDIEEAKEVLCDENLRKEYDSKRFNNKHQYSTTNKNKYSSYNEGYNDVEVDELYFDVASYIIYRKSVSVGEIQRQFKLGYNRVLRILDMLISENFVAKKDNLYYSIIDIETFNKRYDKHFDHRSDNNNYNQSDDPFESYLREQTINDDFYDYNSVHNVVSNGIFKELFSNHFKFTLLIIFAILSIISNIEGLEFKQYDNKSYKNDNSSINTRTYNNNNVSVSDYKDTRTEVPQPNNSVQNNVNNNQYTNLQGWIQEGNSFRYFINGNPVVNGWVNSNNDLYYMNAAGLKEINNWIYYGSNYYYVNEEGKMEKNKWIGNYYVGVDGTMLKNTITPDGYYVGADGKYVPSNTNINNDIGNSRDYSTSLNNTSSSSKTISIDHVNPVDIKKQLSNGKNVYISLLIPVFEGQGSDKLNNLIKRKQNEICNLLVDMVDNSIDEEYEGYGEYEEYDTLQAYINSIDFFESSITYQDGDSLGFEMKGQSNWTNGENDRIVLDLTYIKNSETLEFSIY